MFLPETLELRASYQKLTNVLDDLIVSFLFQAPELCGHVAISDAEMECVQNVVITDDCFQCHPDDIVTTT